MNIYLKIYEFIYNEIEDFNGILRYLIKSLCFVNCESSQFFLCVLSKKKIRHIQNV